MKPSTIKGAKPGDFYCTAKDPDSDTGFCKQRIKGWFAPPMRETPAPGAPAPMLVAENARLTMAVAALQAAAGLGLPPDQTLEIAHIYLNKFLIPASGDQDLGF